MPEKDLPSFDSLEGPEAFPDPLQGEALATQTIDLSSLFSWDAQTSGTFDVSGVGTSSFGRLLDALPVPAILIDQFNRVVFSNQGCAKLTSDYRNMFGVSFLDFLPRPSDKDRAQALADKTLALLERVFRTRKPMTAEAILEIQRKRIWARLNLRAVRIASERYVLVLIEDMTSEKKQLELNRRRDKESAETRRDLETLVNVANSELSVANGRLRREVANHKKTQQLLKVEQQKCEMLAQQAELATAVVAPTGTFQLMDGRFQELCGYELHEAPNLRELFSAGVQDEESEYEYETMPAWLDCLDRSAGTGTPAPTCALTCRGAEAFEVRVRGVKLEDGNYFIACEKGLGRHLKQPAE